MARFMVKASEFKNVCKAVNDRKLAELKKEIIEILKKQDEKDVKKAIDYFNSQEEHYTHLEKSLISGKWIQKAGYGVGTVRIWKGKKYKKIAPGKWARVFDKEGRGTNIAIGKLIARVQKIDNVEDLMAFVMENKQRFVDENGIDLPVLDKLRAAVDAKNNGDMGSKTTSKPAEKKGEVDDYKKQLEDVVKEELVNQKEDVARLYDKGTKGYAIGMDLTDKDKNTSVEDRIQEAAEWLVEHPKGNPKSIGKMLARVELAKEFEKKNKEEEKPAESTTTAELINKNKDKIEKYGIDIYKDEISNSTPTALKDMDEKELKDFIEFTDYLKKESEKIEANANNQDEKNKAWMSAAHSEQLNRMAKNRLKAVIAQNEPIKDFNTEVANSVDIENFKKELDDSYNSEFRVASRLSEGDTDYSEGAIKFDKLVKNDKGAKDFIEKISNTNVDEIDSSLYKTVVMDLLEKEGFFKESEAEKTVEETKETPKEEKTEKIYSVDNSGKVVSFDELQPIASNKSVGENEVQLPYSKDLANEIESLKDCVAPKWDNREFMKHVYYEDGKLVTTDARRMKFIDVGELEGIPDGSYVDITTDKSGINIKKLDGMDEYKFPNYKRVIPEDLNQKATLDTKLVKNKIKEMQKDGAISKKGTNLVQLEFRDGKIFIDDTAVGEAKDIKMKYGDGWGPAREDTNFIAFNADYLVNALSGKTSVLQIGERADKAMAINTGSSSNILMPMSGSNTKMDYGKGRQEKNDANEKKAALKEAYKNTNVEFINSIKEKKGDRFKKVSEMAANDLENRMSAMDDETLKLNYDRLRFNLDKVLDKKEYITEDTKVDNKLKLSLRDAILYQTMATEHPEVISKFADELEKRGISVKKSLFDDFVVDMFVDEDEEEIEEEQEEESLFNDYSAEQPDLFNSTEMKVQEAFNRCGCCL